jgi:nucleoid-associated protein YgaU
MSVNYDAASRYRLDSTGLTASRISVNVRNYTLYIVRQGDTLEAIAARQYGNMRRYWEIADANPQVQFPLDLVMGQAIRLPR